MEIKQAVSTMTMIRSLVDDSAMSMIPNELLFEIFSWLDLDTSTSKQLDHGTPGLHSSAVQPESTGPEIHSERGCIVM